MGQDCKAFLQLPKTAEDLSLKIEDLQNNKDFKVFFDVLNEIQNLTVEQQELSYLENLSEDCIIKNYLTHWTTQYTSQELSALNSEQRKLLSSFREKGRFLKSDRLMTQEQSHRLYFKSLTSNINTNTRELNEARKTIAVYDKII